ncbi:hypothetical protein FKP32DRAFT_1600894 [Trametes sanguinea]|nr:hypothetical protein FKP32DRAFT_1600894 [Trametes sanguinea]
MSTTWPDAKHQLCFWHGVRAVKQRLCKSKDTPAPYDSRAANREFPFIDPEFVPAAQCQTSAEEELPNPPPKPLPRVRLTINGRPPVLSQSLPRIVLAPEAIARALRSTRGFDIQRAGSCAARPSTIAVTDPEDEAGSDESDGGTYWAAKAQAGEDIEGGETSEWEDLLSSGSEIDEDDCRRELDHIERDHSNVNPEAPSIPSETGPRAKAPDYQFCPAAHRLSILRLFAKHACQHPLLPERHGTARSAEDIYRDAVEEMYRHCKSNHLREVWAYLWNSWYSRSRWKLWARFAYKHTQFY